MKKPDKRVTIPGNFDGNFHDHNWRHREITDIAERRQHRQEIAIETHYEEFHHYKRFTELSDRCPCWREQDPKPKCPLCYGQGYLPPYQRIGFHTHCVLHVDRPVQALNMYQAWNEEETVPTWHLRETALNGRLESEWISLSTTEGADVEMWTSLSEDEEKDWTYEFRLDGGEWMPVTDLTRYIGGSLRIQLRATVSRDDYSQPVAGFPCLYLRYRVAGCQNIQGTMPQWVLSRERATSGLLDLIDSGQLIVKGKGLTKVEVGDFFHMIKTGKRFRVTGIDSQTVNDVTMEWALQVRKVVENELVSNVV